MQYLEDVISDDICILTTHCYRLHIKCGKQKVFTMKWVYYQYIYPCIISPKGEEIIA
jgi:hypothetical protein